MHEDSRAHVCCVNRTITNRHLEALSVSIEAERHIIAVKIGHIKKCICFSFLGGTVTMCNMEGLPAHYPEGHSNTPQGCHGGMTTWQWEGSVRAILRTLRCKKLLKAFYFPLLLSQWSHRL